MGQLSFFYILKSFSYLSFQLQNIILPLKAWTCKKPQNQYSLSVFASPCASAEDAQMVSQTWFYGASMQLGVQGTNWGPHLWHRASSTVQQFGKEQDDDDVPLQE